MSELTIGNLCCVCCAEDIRAAVRALPGARAVRVDLDRSALIVEGPATNEEIRNAVRAVGYRIAYDERPTAIELAHTARLAPNPGASVVVGGGCRRARQTSLKKLRP
jgi:copper chaperone CopZ